MQIKIEKEAIKALLHELEDVPFSMFSSAYECYVSQELLKIFILKLMKRSMDMKPHIQMELEPPTMRMLQYVLARITTEHPFHHFVISELLIKIDRQCHEL